MYSIVNAVTEMVNMMPLTYESVDYQGVAVRGFYKHGDPIKGDKQPAQLIPRITAARQDFGADFAQDGQYRDGNKVPKNGLGWWRWTIRPQTKFLYIKREKVHDITKFHYKELGNCVCK